MRTLFRLLKRFLANARQSLYRFRLAHMGEGAEIEPNVALQYPANMHIGAGVRIARNAILRANTDKRPGISIGDETLILESVLIGANQGQVTIGRKCWLGPGCLIYGNGDVTIGDNVLVAAHTSINTVSHHAGRTDVPINDQGIYTDPVVIEDDVWIGLNAVILQGVRIGRGSIIGAGAVVNKDIPPWSIAVGMPAKVLRKRDGAPQED
jgi:acetyltransferase-like isoleucine patch superfamily enzyme